MSPFRRLLVYGGTVAALAGQVMLAKSPTPGILLLGLALAAALIELWLYPRTLKTNALGIIFGLFIGLTMWQEPRGWFFLALAAIFAGTSLRTRPVEVGPIPVTAEPVRFQAPDEAAATAETVRSGLSLESSLPWGEEQVVQPPRYLMGALWGLGAAVAGAVAWFLITDITGWELGLVAWAVGHIVGVAVLKGAGHRSDGKLQIMAACLGGLGILGGYYLMVRDLFVTYMADKGMEALSEFQLLQVVPRFVIKEPGIIGAFGLLFIVIGIYDAYRAAGRGQAQ